MATKDYFVEYNFATMKDILKLLKNMKKELWLMCRQHINF